MALRLSISAVLVFLLSAPEATGQPLWAESSVTRGNYGEISFPDGTQGEFYLGPSSVLSIKVGDYGSWYAFIPAQLRGENSGDVSPESSWVVYSEGNFHIGNESHLDIGGLQLSRRESGSRIGSDEASSGICCVRCGMITVCASAVSLSCGACQSENQTQ